MQVSILSAQLGLGLVLVEWYGDDTSFSLRSFIDCFVATHRQSITLLDKNRIHSLKILYPGLA